MSIFCDCQSKLTPNEVEIVAECEKISVEELRDSVAEKHAIVTSAKRGIPPVGIGKGLRKKFATIVGTSTVVTDILPVIYKARTAQEYGASAIHDGSVGGNVDAIHNTLLKEINIPVGFCHPTRVAALCEYQERSFLDVEPEEFVSLLEEDASSGCEILLGPFSVTMDLVDRLTDSNRLISVPNKTGSLMITWMRHNNCENPYIEQFDRVLRTVHENDVVLSFINGFRSGCIADAMDDLQLAEIRQMGLLVQQAHAAGVQVKVGGGGHVPLNKVPLLFQFEREHIAAPIISFGPQVTDISLAYDHITSAIGQSYALMNGADMILTITAAEHLALPTVEEVRESCIIARYVCHSVDLAGGKDVDLDLELSKSRERLDWETQLSFAVDPLRVELIHRREETKPGCSMCGEFCAYLVMRQADRELSEMLKAKSAGVML